MTVAWFDDVKYYHDPASILRREYVEGLLSRWAAGFPTTALDVGCGNGRVCFSIARRRPHAVIWGIDVDDAAVKSASQRALARGARNVHFEQRTAAELSPDSRFDLITYVDVLEHVADDGRELTVAAGLLAEGGVLVIHSPGLRQRHYFGVSDDDDSFAGGTRFGHQRQGFDAAELAVRVAALGLTVAAVVPTVGPFFAWLSDCDYVMARWSRYNPLRLLTCAGAYLAAPVERRGGVTASRGFLLLARNMGVKPSEKRGNGAVGAAAVPLTR